MTGYALGVVGFTVAFLLFCAVLGPTVGRLMDEFIARRVRDGEQEIADPILAAHRGRRVTYTVPRTYPERTRRS